MYVLIILDKHGCRKTDQTTRLPVICVCMLISTQCLRFLSTSRRNKPAEPTLLVSYIDCGDRLPEQQWLVTLCPHPPGDPFDIPRAGNR